MCRVPKGEKREEFGFKQELIQIGAVLLNEEFEICDTFLTYVKPRFGCVDSFIERLTGITEGDTQNAPSTEEALEAFLMWMPEDTIMVSWSNSDPIQLYKEIDGKQINMPRMEELIENSVDCQIEFEDRIGANRSYGLAEALSITGIDCASGAHDALIDAKNTAMLFAKLNLESKLKMSKYYFSEEDMSAYMATSGFGLKSRFVYA